MFPGTRIGELETDIIGALERDEIRVHFQPQFSCRDNRLIAAEALAHWQHPRMGRLDGASLFEIAGRAGCEISLSRHVLSQALRACARWPGRIGLSVNVTVADLLAEDFVEHLLDVLREEQVSSGRLNIEITEQAVLSGIDITAARLSMLEHHGIGIALDDFGAGFCHFGYLKKLPLAGLKLDRSMVDGISNNLRDLAVFRGILAMAKALGLWVVAEGIETTSMREAARREGCAAWQGFLGGKPLTEEEFSQLAG